MHVAHIRAALRKDLNAASVERQFCIRSIGGGDVHLIAVVSRTAVSGTGPLPPAVHDLVGTAVDGVAPKKLICHFDKRNLKRWLDQSGWVDDRHVPGHGPPWVDERIGNT